MNSWNKELIEGGHNNDSYNKVAKATPLKQR